MAHCVNPGINSLYWRNDPEAASPQRKHQIIMRLLQKLAYVEVMTITLNSEQERIIEEEIRTGHFSTPAEVLDHALASLREKGSGPLKPLKPRSLVEVLSNSPFAGSELELDRQKDESRPIDL